jgi:tetratricopeptide (TPR) repeat protein
MFYGSTHVDAVLSEAEAFLARVEGSARAFEIFLTMAALRAMRGEAAASRALYLRGKSLGQELGIPTALTAGAKYAEEVGLLLGDAEFAEREQRAGVEYLEAVGERGFRSTLAAQLADSLYELGRHAEAQHFADLSLELTSTLDIASQAKGRAVMGKLLAIQGDYEAGERLAREATKLASNTDSLFMQGQVLMSLAEVLRLAGRDADAIPVLREATVISERKGNVVTAQRARARLAALHAATRA